MSGGRRAAAGSVVAALAASACCWLPAVLVLAGLSGVGAAALLERFRPFLLGAAVLALAAGFHASYRAPRCAPDGSCPPADRFRRISRAALWISTALVAAFAFFPGAIARAVAGGAACCEAIAASAGLEAGAVVAAADPTGEWVADLITGEGTEDTTRLVVDLGVVQGRWVGQFDLLDYGVEDYPVEVTVSADTVALRLTAMRTDFRGTLSADGNLLAGTATTEGQQPERIELRRVAAEPHFSDEFLEIETGARGDVLPLASDAAELRERFNADAGKARLLLLLSPT